MFNSKKKEIESLKLDNTLLRKNIKDSEDEIFRLKGQIILLEKKNNELNNKDMSDKIKEMELLYNKLDNDIKNKKEELSILKENIINEEEKYYIQTCGFYNLEYPSEYYKDKLKAIRNKQKQMLLDKSYYKCITKWVVNNNTKDGEKLAEFLVKTCISSFNLTCDTISEKITISNLEKMKAKAERIYENFNKELKKNDLELSNIYLKLKKEEFELQYKVILKKQQEKEEKEYQKELIKQQALAEKELEKEKEKLEKELLTYKIQEESGKDVTDKIEQIKEKLEMNDYRRCHELSGYVYFIINKSFNNDNCVKIGVTRRTDPFIRVDELSSASVPFKFKPLGIVFTENAYDLENRLHKRLDKYRVNKANIRKEYFNIDIDELENIVNNEFNININFNRNIIDEDYDFSIDKSK